MSAKSRDAVDVTIRSVQASDARVLHEACWPERSYATVQMRVKTVLDLAARSRGWGLVAEVAGEMAGYGQITRWHRFQFAEISNLVVVETWRGYGIGTMLIEELLTIARGQGIQRVEIGVARANTRAKMLYERLGFTPARQVIMDFGDGPEEVIYLSMAF